jgi:hypothetical protein
MGAVAGSPALRRGLERCYWPVLAAAWTGFPLVAAGALVHHQGGGTAALLVGAPLLGLCVWVRRDAAPGDHAPPAPRPEPGGPEDEIDWDRFMRDLDRWSAPGGRAPDQVEKVATARSSTGARRDQRVTGAAATTTVVPRVPVTMAAISRKRDLPVE